MNKIKQMLPFMVILLLPACITAQSSTQNNVNVANRSEIINDIQHGKSEITITIGNISFDMIKVESGDFNMGASEEGYIDDDERGLHKVTITNDYYIGKFEVTDELFRAVIGEKYYDWYTGIDSESKWQQQNHPVVYVSWNASKAFCEQLSQMTGLQFRLPTEAEWEYAAYGGKYSKNTKYSGSDDIDSVAWHNSEESGITWQNYTQKGITHPVGQLKPNELGIYDMSGNVWEWCYDWKDGYKDVDQTNPTGPVIGERRVLRGGSWYNDENCCRILNRTSNEPDFKRCDVGFRIVLCIGSLVNKKQLPQVRTFTETALGLNMKMVYVEGGTFKMGCTKDQCNECMEDEIPVRNVTLKPFYIGTFEVTQSQWEKVMGTTIKNQSHGFTNGDGDNYPMYYVSWEDAKEFCKRLSQKTGKKYSLPTEAEWEYAARGGKYGDKTKYSGSSLIDNVAWYDGNSGDKVHPVGQLQPNTLGIYDMSGNVWEWCEDWYGEYDVTDVNNPSGPSEGEMRILRGTGWSGNASECRVAYRPRNYPDERGRDDSNGFRVVLHN